MASLNTLSDPTSFREDQNAIQYQRLPNYDDGFVDMQEAKDLEEGEIDADAESAEGSEESDADPEGTESAEKSNHEDDWVNESDVTAESETYEGTCYDTELLVAALGNLTEELKEIKQEMVYLMYTIAGCCTLVSICALM